MTIKHFWDNDEYIDGRIHDQFEVSGWIYVIGNKLINEEYGENLSKIGFSSKPLSAVTRWRRDADEEIGWTIYGVYGRVDSCADIRIHKHLEEYGIQRVVDPRIGQEWFRIPGRDAASVVRFYLAARKKYSLRVWVPKEFR